jgi:hypothetical protein
VQPINPLIGAESGQRRRLTASGSLMISSPTSTDPKQVDLLADAIGL